MVWFIAAFSSVPSIVSRVVASGFRGVRIGNWAMGGGGSSTTGGALEITIETNAHATAEFFGNLSKQMRFATAVALTRTTKRLIPLMEQEVSKSFDRPTNFTVRAFGSTMATPATLTSELFIKPRQAEYLATQIHGGRRPQKRFEKHLAGEANADGYWAPGEGVRLNAAGNLTLRQIQEISGKLRATGRFGEVFVGVPRGHPGAPFGIWSRTMRGRGRNRTAGIRPLLIKIAAPGYSRKFDFFGVAKKHAQRIFNEEFHRAFEQAKRTARPSSSGLKTIFHNVVRLG
ncbi:MAG: hypothetical protein KKF85_15425 [Gammaproteobacteria bacterium]|nr:hypothetical protein [Rhodocyclaceae bacterium]MBU3907943.1 hypothetical protein [Gammaproteobacteria bacterium]MBU3989785.1 hypothetical protein [Gammaproteobacteria bacterium]MBU4003849.1 hypothetical protein [Gammaproteobacteria bacterium]MBU4021727.1 hypothetical protein [Gammaproteobacteria bacterium]